MSRRVDPPIGMPVLPVTPVGTNGDISATVWRAPFVNTRRITSADGHGVARIAPITPASASAPATTPTVPRARLTSPT
ncbi:hypothetical protein [Leifsonia xyli]|uniref:hypothetical protein n=1 Tax=Leifsonia xyli TaxID=1575 RepID=UPI003D669B29